MKDIIIGLSLLWLIPWSIFVTAYIQDLERKKKK